MWDPARWGDVLRSSRRLREQLRRARAKGVVARAVSPGEIEDAESPLRREVERLMARWASSRPMAPMGFLVQLEPFSFAGERRYVVPGIVPCRDGWVGVNCLTGQHWLDMCALLEIPDWSKRQRPVIEPGDAYERFLADARPWLEQRSAGGPQRGAPRWRSKNSVMRRR